MGKKSFLTVFRVVLISAVIMLSAAGLEAVNMQEGEWETVTEMVMEGMPFPMPPTKMNTCITKKDMIPRSENDKNCTFKDQQISGNIVRWHVVCKDSEGTSDGRGEITYSGKSYKGTIKMTVTDKKGASSRMTMKMSGKHLGPCSK